MALKFLSLAAFSSDAVPAFTRPELIPSVGKPEYDQCYTFAMKTAISIPDPIFQSAEALARKLKTTRSDVYARAVALFVQQHSEQDVTARLNAVYASEDNRLDKSMARMQAETLKRHSTW